jgi:arylsulfatase A-like enzyme
MAAFRALERPNALPALRYTERMLLRLRTAPRAGRLVFAAACAALALPPLGCGGSAPVADPTGPPNLLLVTVDTLRADRMACYGGRPDVATFLCSLADAGTRFEWAFSTAPYTAPSIASILTGVYPSAHGVRQSAVSYLRGEIDTLPELLQAAGYTTAAFISNPVLERSRQLDQGFGVFDQRMPREERNRPGFVEREARSTTDAALAWAQVAAEPPWFVWVHFQDPHGPYEPPDAAAAYDDPAEARLPLLRNDESGLGGIPAYQQLPGLFTQKAYEDRYLDEIQYLDEHVRRLVTGLDALGDPPAVLLTADHGEAFGEDGYYFAHGHSVGLDQIRVPLLWRPTAAAAPSVVSAPVSLIDVAPTLLRVAGVETPATWTGRPLPVGGGDAAADRAIFAEHGRRAAIISGGVYYARDRRPVAPDEVDLNSRGPVKLLPSRTARLVGLPATDRKDAARALPVYELADRSDAAAALEPALARFLAAAATRRAGAVHDSVPTEMQERLRALGYSD